MSKRNTNGLFLMTTGLLLMAAALALLGYNLWDTDRAEQSSVEALEQVLPVIEKNQEEILTFWETNLPEDEWVPDYVYNPQREMPRITVEELEYIGVISIPDIEIELPVLSSWNYDNLRVAPSRYSGSVYTNDLVICAHNYVIHFGKLRFLNTGSPITFRDVEGNEFLYTVTEIETLAPNAIAEMKESYADLTLFTCTLGGSERVTVRCELANK